MTQTDLYLQLTSDQKRLHDYLEANDYRIYLFEQDGLMCAEVENYTDGGVDMIISLMPFTLAEMREYYDDFDIDDTIDLHRQDPRYCQAFRITESVRDFEAWQSWLESLLCNYSAA